MRFDESVYNDTSTTQHSCSFYSKECSDSSKQPYITINYYGDGIYKIKNSSGYYIGYANNHADKDSNVISTELGQNDFAKEYRFVYSSSKNAYTIRPIASKDGYDLYLSYSGSDIILSQSETYFTITPAANNNNRVVIKPTNTSYSTKAISVPTSGGDIFLATYSSGTSTQELILEWSSKNEEYPYYYSLGFAYPVSDLHVSSRYGVRHFEGKYTDHYANDFDNGDMVYSISDGTVVCIGEDDSMGNYVIVDTGKTAFNDSSKHIYVLYAHFGLKGSNDPDYDIKVSVGNTISKGEEIGKPGDTGSATGEHLHLCIFTYIKDGIKNGWNRFNYFDYSTTIDPRAFYDNGKAAYDI